MGKGELMNSKRSKGQVLVLACVTMLIMALTVMLSFNVGNAIHERIRLQSHADSVAFSAATLAARSLNTSAHLNRAIASALSGLMSVHAYYAVADDVINQMNQSSKDMQYYAGEELKLCPPCKGPCAIHCIHAAEAMKASTCYSGEAGKVSGARESGYSGAITELQQMIVKFHQEQNQMISWTQNEIGNGATINRLHEINAPFASNNLAAGATQASYACAFEGSDIDGSCAFINGQSPPSVLDAAARDKTMSSVAMAARVELTDGLNKNGRNMAAQDYTNGPNKGNGTITKPPVYEKCQKCLGSADKNWTTPVGITTAWLGSKGHTNGSSVVAADVESKPLTTQWGCKEHNWSQTHSIGGSSQDARGSRGYQGVPCSGADCFINFRVKNDKNISYNMPSTYGAVSQELRILGRRGPGAKRPWEINQQGHIHQQNSAIAWDITLPPIDKGYAVAKGKAYFHQLGQGNGWHPAPNSFDAFWRAKLHPFGREELVTLLGQVGDSKGSEVAGDAPVEGDRNAP